MINKKLYQLTTLVFFLSCFLLENLYSQPKPLRENSTVTGIVYSVFDSTKILPGANVILYKHDTFYAGAAADKNGKYILSEIPNGKYSLQGSFMGYENMRIDISIETSDTMHLDIAIGKILPISELPFSEYDARKDIANGKVKLLTYGLQILNTDKIEKKLEKLRQKYGFNERNLGDDINPKLIQAIERYNKEVRVYLENRNGSDWYEKYIQECDEIIKRK